MVYLFENFRLDSDRRELHRGAALLQIEPQVFDLLRFLIDNRDRVVSKDDLIGSVWGGRVVSDSTLDNRINAVRRAIGDSGRESRLIRTIIGKGIRFVGTVQEPSFASVGRTARAVEVKGVWRNHRRSLAAAAAALVLVLLTGIWWVRHFTPQIALSQAAPTLSNHPAKPLPRISIVVLPFTNLSGDTEQEYFVDAVTDGLTSDLSRIANSFVIARTTAFTYKGKAIDVKQVGRDLGVSYILEGSVRRSGEDVHVAVQLIDAETGGDLWNDRADTDRGHLLKAQDEITARLAQALQLELFEVVARRIERDNPIKLDAQDLVMRGWALYYRPQTVALLREAQGLFERALAADPESVDARVGIAIVLGELLATGRSESREQDMALADRLLGEALERDANQVEALAELGRLRRSQGRMADSLIELKRALALDQSNARGIIQMGTTLLLWGKPAEALPYFDRFLKINPKWQNLFFIYYWLGQNHLLLNQPDQAITYLKTGRALNPNREGIRIMLAAALGLRGDIEEAKTALGDFWGLRPDLGSFTKLSAEYASWDASPEYVVLRQKTIDIGLRRAGLPQE